MIFEYIRRSNSLVVYIEGRVFIFVDGGYILVVDVGF